MAFFVGFLKVHDGQPGVVVERVQGLVAEQFLDVVHVRATPDQLGRAASPECVGGNRKIKIHPAGVTPDHPLQIMVRVPFAVPVEEQRRFMRIVHEERPHGDDVTLEEPQGGPPHRHHPFFLAFAHDPNRLVVEVDVVHVEIKDLPGPQAG